MIVVPLSDRASAIRDALQSHQWEADLAWLSADGAHWAAFHVRGVTSNVIEAMLPVAARLGLDLITGDDWLIVAGARSRLGAFARPWVQPEPVRELALAVGMAMPPDDEPVWFHARGSIALDGPVMVGILNVTPDSFSDGGRIATVGDALRAAETLVAGGATIVDIGGESTRPHADPISAYHEIDRILPIVLGLVREFPGCTLSVDTLHAATAEAAVDAGCAIVNDVTAGRHDPALLDVVARSGAGLVLSHSRGDVPRLASYDGAEYDGDVTGQVAAELADAVVAADAAGVPGNRVVVDPGFGFGKRSPQSWTLLQQLDGIVAMGRPVMVGLSRKRFLGEASGREAADRDRATAAACALAYQRGARLFRVHHPEAVRDALAVAQAMMRTPRDAD
jgi:dihydropteroate synthase